MAMSMSGDHLYLANWCVCMRAKSMCEACVCDCVEGRGGAQCAVCVWGGGREGGGCSVLGVQCVPRLLAVRVPMFITTLCCVFVQPRGYLRPSLPVCACASVCQLLPARCAWVGWGGGGGGGRQAHIIFARAVRLRLLPSYLPAGLIFPAATATAAAAAPSLSSAFRCSVQRVADRTNMLSAKRRMKLEKLGFDWTGADPLS